MSIHRFLKKQPTHKLISDIMRSIWTSCQHVDRNAPYKGIYMGRFLHECISRRLFGLWREGQLSFRIYTLCNSSTHPHVHSMDPCIFMRVMRESLGRFSNIRNTAKKYFWLHTGFVFANIFLEKKLDLKRCEKKEAKKKIWPKQKWLIFFFFENLLIYYWEMRHRNHL